MDFKEDEVVEYYLKCIETGGKTINDIDAGPVRKRVKAKVEEIVIRGEANIYQKKALARWLAFIKKPLVGVDAEIMTEINNMMEEYQS